MRNSTAPSTAGRFKIKPVHIDYRKKISRKGFSRRRRTLIKIAFPPPPRRGSNSIGNPSGNPRGTTTRRSAVIVGTPANREPIAVCRGRPPSPVSQLTGNTRSVCTYRAIGSLFYSAVATHHRTKSSQHYYTRRHAVLCSF